MGYAACYGIESGAGTKILEVFSRREHNVDGGDVAFCKFLQVFRTFRAYRNPEITQFSQLYFLSLQKHLYKALAHIGYYTFYRSASEYAIVVGIGAFIAFIGMKSCGIVVNSPSTFVTLGNLAQPATLLSVAGIFLIGGLLALNVPGAMIIGILVVTLAGIALGVTQLPEGQVFSFSLPLPTETFLQMDLKGALHHGLISIIFTLTMVDLFDNMGVLIGLAQKAGFVREDGHIENLDRALITDSVATMTSAVMGATTATSYLESAAGVAEGGRTGLTAVTIAALFFLALFFTPLVGLVPAYATAPVLIIVGALMMQEVGRIRFDDFTVALPAFLTILSMPLTFNIATGFGFGFVSWVGVKLLAGRFKDVNLVMLIIALCFVINFALRLG